MTDTTNTAIHFCYDNPNGLDADGLITHFNNLTADGTVWDYTATHKELVDRLAAINASLQQWSSNYSDVRRKMNRCVGEVREFLEEMGLKDDPNAEEFIKTMVDDFDMDPFVTRYEWSATVTFTVTGTAFLRTDDTDDMTAVIERRLEGLDISRLCDGDLDDGEFTMDEAVLESVSDFDYDEA